MIAQSHKEVNSSQWFLTTEKLVIDVPTAAELLGISRSSGYEAARRGEIPTLRLGRRLVVPVEELRAMLGVRFVSKGEVVPNPGLRD